MPRRNSKSSVDKDIFILEFLPVSSQGYQAEVSQSNHAHKGTGYYEHKPTKVELQRLQLSEWSETGYETTMLIMFKKQKTKLKFSSETSVQFSHSVVSDSLQPHESQHTRPPCPSPTPGVHSDSCPLSQWCHPAISSSVVPFSSCPQIPPSIRVFSNESTPHEVAKVLEFQL